MNVIISKKGSNRNESHRYHIWLRDFVNKGIAHEYDILQYPNLAILTVLDCDGYKIRQEVREYTEVKRLADTQPKDYKITTFDIEKLKLKHIKRSKRIYFKKSLSIVSPLKILISCSNSRIFSESFLVHSIESSPWIRITKKRIKNAMTTSFIILGILVPLYIAYRQGIKLF